MKPGDIKKLLKLWIENEIDVSVCLIGGMGIGKSWVPKDLAKELGVGYDGIFPSQMGDGSEMTGIPFREGNIQRWSVPENLPSLDKQYKCRLCIYDDISHTHKKGFYVVDELNTAPIDVRNAMMEFMLSGSIHRNKINGHWVRIACMNPETEGFQVEALSKALLRRMVLIKLEPDYDTWKNEWAENNIDNEILNFLSNHKDMFFKKENFSIETEYNPDSYRMLTEIKKKLPWNELEEPIKFEIIQGLCGKEVAAQMISYFKTDIKPITSKELFSDYKNKINNFLKQRNDLIIKSIENVISDINETERMGKEKAINFCDLISKISTEAQILCIRKIDNNAIEKIHKNSCNSPDCGKEDKERETRTEEKIIELQERIIKKYPDNPFNKWQSIKVKIYKLEKELKENEKTNR